MAKRTRIKDLLNTTEFGQQVIVMGWVKTFRNNQFISINDGSSINNIQAVVDFNSMDESLLKRLTTGAAISVEGELIESMGKGQRVEVKVSKLEILGDSDAEKFPLQPKKHLKCGMHWPMEFINSLTTKDLYACTPQLLPLPTLKVQVRCFGCLHSIRTTFHGMRTAP